MKSYEAIRVGEIMARYWRFRKREGQWPRWGPYAVVRKHRDLEDFCTTLPYERPLIDLSLQAGFYIANYMHIQFQFSILYEEIYWEVW
jgi:hypothetical protein